MTEERYISLIHLELTGQLTEEGKVLLDEWKAGNPENAVIYQQVRTAWKVSSDYGSDMDIDTEADYGKLMKRIDSGKGRVVRFNYIRWSVIAASILLIVSLFFMMRNSPAIEITATSDNFVHALPDGSRLILSDRSQVTYQQDFEDNRQLTINGAILVQVTHDPNRPFTILSQAMVTRVLGTTFFIKDREGDTPSVSLIEGSVSVQARASGTSRLLEPGQNAIMNGDDFTISSGRVTSGFEWFQDVLQFQGISLAEVADELGDHFNVTINVPGNLQDCIFTGRYAQQTMPEVLNSIATLYGATLERDQNGYTLSGGSCE